MVWDTIDTERLSPMMAHYVSIKNQYPDCIIMYRLGDFYEMFFDDAVVSSRVLELALTGRDCGLDERCPMAGVPHQVIQSYAAKLVSNGYKVCLVDQMEDPKEAKGLVKRAVTRILTPGTISDQESLNMHENNYLLSAYLYDHTVGLCYADISTGQVYTTQWKAKKPADEIDSWSKAIHPSEILILQDEQNRDAMLQLEELFRNEGIPITHMDAEKISPRDLKTKIAHYTKGKGASIFRNRIPALLSTVSLFDYVYAFQEEVFPHLQMVQWIEPHRYLEMNAATRDNLELLVNLQDHTRKDTLLSVLDQARTAMGSRKIASWIEMPLLDREQIEERLDTVEALVKNASVRMKLRELLYRIYDLERLLSKLSFNRSNARDLRSLAISLEPLPEIQQVLLHSSDHSLEQLGGLLDPMEDIRRLIESAIVPDPPISITEGGMIQKGYDEALDALREGSEDAQSELLQYEARLREQTGIKTLRIVYRKNQGYFIEVTKSYQDRVPEEFQRRQTLKNAERYTTDFLEAQAGRILGSATQSRDMEYAIFQRIRASIAEQSLRIQEQASLLATLDGYAAFAELACDRHYVRPRFHDEDVICIEEGRHPVVESKMHGEFIPNDLQIGEEHNRIQIITGPNMAGKSTYMRQNALILIMAQIGSFVPASKCELPVTDRIFTRIGATDHLARGESTFMVEMMEMADILRDATAQSFLVLDEVGRGTSTDDGLAIAYAILEYLSKKLPAKTLFATHYHELTILGKPENKIQNRKVEITESDGELVFLRRVTEGKANRSYGIEVARLSGIPEAILTRASHILANIDQIHDVSFVKEADASHNRQQDFRDFQREALLSELARVDVNHIAPMDALIQLSTFVQRASALISDSEKEDL